jgi:hypothetical protein
MSVRIDLMLPAAEKITLVLEGIGDELFRKSKGLSELAPEG